MVLIDEIYFGLENNSLTTKVMYIFTEHIVRKKDMPAANTGTKV